jgi:hypothetical protein
MFFVAYDPMEAGFGASKLESVDSDRALFRPGFGGIGAGPLNIAISSTNRSGFSPAI